MRLEAFRVKGFGTFREEFSFDLRDYADAKLIAICGPNGAGKSTALELALAGACYRKTPTRGSLKDLALERECVLETRLVNGAPWTIRHKFDAISGKGESLVLDANGAPVLPDSKVSSFDAWAARKLPPDSVLFSTQFAPQGSSGFFGLTGGDQTAVLLRVCGVERIEQMAERARKHASAAKAELETLTARIRDERERGGDPAGAAVRVASAEQELERAEASLHVARGNLDDARARAAAAPAAREAYEAARRERDRLLREVSEKATKITDLENRVANNRRVLAEADDIRAAVERVAALRQEIADAERRVAELLREADALEAENQRMTNTAADASERAQEAKRRAERARVRLRDRTAVAVAVDTLHQRRAELKEAEDALAAAEAELEELRGKRVAGAEERVAALRGGLHVIAHLGGSEPLQRAVEIAEGALALDDGEARLATQLPSDIDDATERVHAARDRVAVARRVLADTEALAARKEDVAAAEAELAAAEQEAAQHTTRFQELMLEARRHRPTVEAKYDAQREAVAAIDRMNDELRKAEPVAARAAPLAQAEARLEELEPQLAAALADRERLQSELSATPEPAPPPTAPDVAAFEAELRKAEAAAETARTALEAARLAREAAEESAARVAELETQRVAFELELADWNRVAADCGRDGMQAMLVDAAGPEITEIVNDLLHAAFGPRFSMRIDTQRLDAKGHRLLEDVRVMVIDTEKGREAPASTFSGGEKVILQEAFSLALTKVSCRENRVERPTIIRDESGAALDPKRAPQYVAMLRRAAEIIDADKLLVVSHVPEVQELCDARIEVGR